jgi:hypothetical protein
LLVAVALVAAAAGNALVESAANAGLFGAGYADDNHASVIPTLCAGGAIALDVARRRCADVLRRGEALRTDWLVDVARAHGGRVGVADAFLVVAMQFCALFGMESVERVAFGATQHGPAAWLGGPILWSVLAHCAVGLGCAFLIAACVRAILLGFASLVRAAVAFIAQRSRGGAPRDATNQERRFVRRAQLRGFGRGGDRAPPLVSLATA